MNAHLDWDPLWAVCRTSRKHHVRKKFQLKSSIKTHVGQGDLLAEYPSVIVGLGTCTRLDYDQPLETFPLPPDLALFLLRSFLLVPFFSFLAYNLHPPPNSLGDNTPNDPLLVFPPSVLIPNSRWGESFSWSGDG